MRAALVLAGVPRPVLAAAAVRAQHAQGLHERREGATEHGALVGLGPRLPRGARRAVSHRAVLERRRGRSRRRDVAAVRLRERAERPRGADAGAAARRHASDGAPSADATLEEVADGPPAHQKDPILLFGGLVPPPLRKAKLGLLRGPRASHLGRQRGPRDPRRGARGHGGVRRDARRASDVNQIPAFARALARKPPRPRQENFRRVFIRMTALGEVRPGFPRGMIMKFAPLHLGAPRGQHLAHQTTSAGAGASVRVGVDLGLAQRAARLPEAADRREQVAASRAAARPGFGRGGAVLAGAPRPAPPRAGAAAGTTSGTGAGAGTGAAGAGAGAAGAGAGGGGPPAAPAPAPSAASSSEGSRPSARIFASTAGRGTPIRSIFAKRSARGSGADAAAGSGAAARRARRARRARPRARAAASAERAAELGRRRRRPRRRRREEADVRAVDGAAPPAAAVVLEHLGGGKGGASASSPRDDRAAGCPRAVCLDDVEREREREQAPSPRRRRRAAAIGSAPRHPPRGRANSRAARARTPAAPRRRRRRRPRPWRRRRRRGRRARAARCLGVLVLRARVPVASSRASTCTRGAILRFGGSERVPRAGCVARERDKGGRRGARRRARPPPCRGAARGPRGRRQGGASTSSRS